MSDSICPNNYTVINDKQVHLTVTIGNGQLGSTTVKLDGETKINGNIDDDLGTGEVLTGKVLLINTTVNKANNSTNNASVTYNLTGGTTTVNCSQGKTFSGQKPLRFSQSFNLGV